MKICQISHVIFGNTSHFFQILHQSSLPSNITSLFFFSSNVIYLKKVPVLRFFSRRVKISQILPVSFELTSQFLFMFFTILHCHENVFCIFDKRVQSKSRFRHFQVFWWNLANSSYHFRNLKSNFLQFCMTLQCRERQFFCIF